MRQLKRQDRTKDMHLERKKKENSAEGSPSITPETKHTLKWGQTEDKPVMPAHSLVNNKQATEEKDGFKPGQNENKQPTIGLQLDYKQTTDTPIIGLQLDYKQSTADISANELDYKQATEQTTDKSTIGLQLDYKQSTKWHISSLYGHERNLLFFVFAKCKNSGALVTDPISNIQLRESLNIRSSSTIKTVIDRVIKKGFLTKKPGKTGRGGWMIFEMQKSTFQDLLLGEMDYKQFTISLQTDHKQSTKQTTEQTTTALDSKLDNINNTNLTNTDAWSPTITEHVEKYGINDGVIKRARKISPKLEIDQACTVIEKFRVLMERPGSNNIKNNIGYFISLTQKAASGEEVLPEIEPEAKRLMKELGAKAAEELKQMEEAAENVLEIKFRKWMDSLSSAEKLKIVPSSTLVKEGSHPHTQQFKTHYRENLWPQERKIMLQGKT